MGPRYPAGPRPGVRMPQMGNDFNGVCRKLIQSYLQYHKYLILRKE